MNEPGEDRATGLQRFRGYLFMLARLQVGPRLQAKIDASDIVQQTMVQAIAGLPQFRGTCDGEIAAWLRQILARQLANALRDLNRMKRDVTRERSLEAALDQSASRLELFLAVADSSPSAKAQRDEQLFAVAEALAGLPEAQREAIVLHYLEQCPIDVVAERLERSASAAAGLIKRGLHALREQLADSR
jgi:RNA polymerase sigma-70 factor (ECF subfamily)